MCALLLSVLALLCSCSMSTSDIADETKKLFNESNIGTGIVATDVTLSKVGENMYKGIITLNNGLDTENYSIDVTCDGETLIYNIPDL